MKRPKRLIRKLFAVVVGLPLLTLGIILIPLPGPGVLITLLALFVLSLEFDQAQAPLDKCKAIIKKIYDESKERADKISNKYD